MITEPQSPGGSGNDPTETPGGSGNIIPGDAPPGDTYSAMQAAQAIGVSERRVRELVKDGRITPVQEKPLRVSAQSVHEMRDERRGGTRDPRANLVPENIADQVSRLVDLALAGERKAITMREAALQEITEERNALRAKVAQLESQEELRRTAELAKVEAELVRVEAERASAEEALRVQVESVKKRWWKK